MSLHRRALALGVVGSTVLLTALTSAGTAGAHGSMSNPVSRVAACFAEGPEHPQSQVCKDLVAQSGTQPLYDWNEVNIANANGQHQALIPDGKLCSANRDKYKALDMARTDWPATAVAAGPYNFKFRVTAAHIGLMTVYITKAGYDPTKPLKWSDLDPTPVAQTQVTRTATDGFYNFTGNLPQRTGRQLLYMTWQRSDSPEAFYSCSDVDFPSAQPKLAAAPAAPSDQQIAAAAAKSTVDHYGHGGDTAPDAPAVQAQAAAVGGTSQAGPLMLAGAVAVGAGWGALVLRRRRADAARASA
ncbi:lytic polysaccharide monooxygenase [Kitasatospora sp. NBC_00240]|uniref:lytic polysaccharide monooxygenase auxiliary activity family 9 protein n=1 Tax=Kitasatospora sp. NBC_00240 TaxID=2903567 RepID=UPI00225906E3|nr:lytic polysaccharide monooxygenase [Kitasatospora sp. NBC_00240]MCX5209292.1 lytic polysaccharide monooxygenase [Kitasatospora sp. NBC_00240]